MTENFLIFWILATIINFGKKRKCQLSGKLLEIEQFWANFLVPLGARDPRCSASEKFLFSDFRLPLWFLVEIKHVAF